MKKDEKKSADTATPASAAMPTCRAKRFHGTGAAPALCSVARARRNPTARDAAAITHVSLVANIRPADTPAASAQAGRGDRT